jgi:soluble lytic murein transglycosylase-like protein
MARLRETWLIAAVLLAVTSAARAQVIEVRPDGTTVTYDSPTQYFAWGARPIAKPAHRSADRYSGRPATPSAAVAEAIRAAAARHQVSEQLVEAVAWRESGFNTTAVSPKGAQGVMQLMPGTARLLGVNARDPASNIDGGADYLARMLRRFDGDITKALAAYNAGPQAVERYGGIPPYAETTAYVGAVLERLNRTAPPVFSPSTVIVPGF